MPINIMNNNDELIPKGNGRGDMKKTRQPTEATSCFATLKAHCLWPLVITNH